VVALTCAGTAYICECCGPIVMMMQRGGSNRRKTLTRNAIWFLASLLLSSFVWIIAITQDAQEQGFSPIPVQVDFDEGLIITDQPTRTVRVNVRAPQDVLGLLTNDDIVIEADFRGLGPGTHTVELEPIVSRRLAIADTQPRQITITLEELLAQQVNVGFEITDPPPLDFENGAPEFSESQVMVSGPRSAVQQVVAAVAEFDLSERQETFDQLVRLTPVDVEGNAVDDVTLNPQNVTASVEMRRRDDVIRVSVSPDINFATLQDGYVISGPILYNPPTVFVYGSPEDLAQLPSTLETERIDLTGRLDDFEVNVPVILPEELASLRVNDDQSINVSLIIDAQITNLQVDDVPIIVTGLAQNLMAEFTPQTASVVITGAQSTLDTLPIDDVSVSLNLAGLEVGIHDVDVVPNIGVDTESVAVLPPTIQVIITETETAENTETTETP